MKAPAQFLAQSLLLLLSLYVATHSLSAAPTIAYPQSQPSNREQYLLELINAARANPAAEGQMLAGITDAEIVRYYSYYRVSTGQVLSDFSTYAAKPPLAFNPSLMASSHAQAAYQANSGVQTHDGADGSTFDKRITATGYKWSGIGENVYAYAEGAFFGHVGLTADWGVPSLDHRDNIMNLDARIPTYREIGIACVDTSIKNFGPLVVTQDFGTPADTTLAYVTGVVYQDSNGNGAYDEGEGLAGVTMTPDSGNNYAVTTASGGFVIPLPANGAGTLSLMASGGGLGAARSKSVAYTAGTNVKVDFTPGDPTGSPLPVVTVTTLAKNAIPNLQPGQIVVSRDGDVTQALKVALRYGGTAVNGVDYNALPAKVTIPAGQSSVLLDVQPTVAQRNSTLKLKVGFQAKNTYRVNADAKRAQAKVLILPAQ